LRNPCSAEHSSYPVQSRPCFGGAFFLGFGGGARGFSFSPSQFRHPPLRLLASRWRARPVKRLRPPPAGLSFTPAFLHFSEQLPREPIALIRIALCERNEERIVTLSPAH